MTRLASLRSDLSSLRRMRSRMRWTTALAGVATAAVCTLAAAFALDFAVEGNRAFRAVLLLAVAAFVAWAWQRYATPWISAMETDLDMALIAESQCRAAGSPLGRDLVAAIQFERPEAASWGSVALEHAVIEDVAVESENLNVFAGLSTDTMRRRVRWAAVTLVAATAATAIFPNHVAAFFNRLFLGRMHYPTATKIDTIVINGRDAPPAIGRAPVVVACAEGQPLNIEIRASGTLPENGRMELRLEGDRGATVELTPVAARDDLSNRQWMVYTGRLPRLHDDGKYQVFLGDAWTDEAEIELMPLPVVDCEVQVTPPEYAKAALSQQREEDSRGARSVEAIEGSRVSLEVVCRNKALAKVEAKLGDKSFPLAPVDAEKQRWRLPAGQTPLDEIAQEIRYEITATDEDGLSPERPLEGTVRLAADRPPRITAEARTKYVVPTGRPVLEYRVADDYGISRVTAKATVLREGATGRERLERSPINVPLPGSPLYATTPERRTFPLPLAGLDLAKGDRLELVLEVTDHRGGRAGKSATTEPIVFNVTDANGVAAAVTELDPALEQQIHSLIQKHLDIGASK